MSTQPQQLQMTHRQRQQPAGGQGQGRLSLAGALTAAGIAPICCLGLLVLR
jgi:hypothetical protein